MDRLSFDAQFARNLSALPVRAYSAGLALETLTMIWQYRYLVLTTALLSFLAGIAALSVLPKQYSSEAIVQLDLNRRDATLGPDQLPTVMLEAAAVVQGEARIIRSRPVIQTVVERLGLAEGQVADGQGLARYLASLQAGFAGALTWVVGEDAPAFAARTVPDTDSERLTRAVDDVLRRLTVASDNRTYLLTVTYVSGDPALSARIANAIAEEYLAQRMRASSLAAAQVSDWLAMQIRGATAELRGREAEITSFRNRNNILAQETAGDPESVLQQQLRAVTAQLAAASAARMGEERRLARVEELLRSGGLPSAMDLQGMPWVANLLEREAVARQELRELQARFGSRHPDVRRAQAGTDDLRSKIGEEMRRSVSVIGGDLAAAVRTENELRGELEALQRTMIAGRGDETELRAMVASTQGIRERLTLLTRRNEQAIAARDMPSAPGTLVVPAEPAPRPSSPNPLMITGLALLGGLSAGAAAATMLARRDQGLHTSADVRAAFDTRCLGMVPELPPRTARPADRRKRAIFDEAVQTVCASANLIGPAGECKVVLVTSSVPGEGKTALCRAVAEALYASGRRVMLVSGSPSIRLPPRAREATPAGPSRSQEVLPGPVQDSALVVVERSRSLPLNADVFSPSGLSSRLEEARKHFDAILIEGEPVMLFADSLVLGRLADSVIHVARWADTKQRVVDAALRRLHEHSIIVDGVVLTRVDLSRHARFRHVDECFLAMQDRPGVSPGPASPAGGAV